MAAIPKKPKCCSKRAVKLKTASYAKAKKAADAGRSIKKAPAKKAAAKKAPPAKKAKPCRMCGKK